VWIERIVLEDHSDIAVSRWNIGHIALADADRAMCRSLEPGDEPQGGSLAGARRADEHDELAIADIEVEVGDRYRVVKLLGKVLQTYLSHDRKLLERLSVTRVRENNKPALALQAIEPFLSGSGPAMS
jgi:hypothetical protein